MGEDGRVEDAVAGRQGVLPVAFGHAGRDLDAGERAGPVLLHLLRRKDLWVIAIVNIDELGALGLGQEVGFAIHVVGRDATRGGDKDGHRGVVIDLGDVGGGERGELRDEVQQDVAVDGFLVDALEDDPVLAALDGGEGIDERGAFRTLAEPGVAVGGAGFEVGFFRLGGVGVDPFGRGEQRVKLEGGVQVQVVAELEGQAIEVAGEQGSVLELVWEHGDGGR